MRNYKSRRRGFTLLQAVIVLAIAVILAAILLPVFGRRSEHRGYCQSNLKQIGLGFKQYLQDYDEKYPIVATTAPYFGWAASLQPYLKSTQIFQCPIEETASSGDPAQLQYTDYWFNARMAGANENRLDNEAQTILLGDGNDGHDSTDAFYNLFAVPQRWRDDQKSPLHRHLGSANLAFADGHAKSIRVEQWKSGSDTSQGYTFQPIQR